MSGAGKEIGYLITFSLMRRRLSLQPKKEAICTSSRHRRSPQLKTLEAKGTFLNKRIENAVILGPIHQLIVATISSNCSGLQLFLVVRRSLRFKVLRMQNAVLKTLQRMVRTTQYRHVARRVLAPDADMNTSDDVVTRQFVLEDTQTLR